MRWGDRLPSQSELYDLKKAEIVRAATQFFSRSGYHGTSLVDVGVALGVTKQALYYYFKDKQTLLHACAVAAHQGTLDILAEENGRPTRNGREALARVLQRYAVHAANGHLQFIMFLDSGILRPEHLAEVLRLRDDFDAGIRRMIEAGIADGSLRPGNPKMMSFAVLGAVNWISRWYRPEGPLSIEEVAAAIVDFALQGIATSEPSASPER
ncbi:MAG TPA: TetR/AcrR family transcriptional regulator [Stellaceae bacterium]|jgi:TetR/AcrR family transcriptional regulator